VKLKIFQVDAFANAIFEGNPAAVCVLDDWLPDMLMQAVAGEMNLSETAFLVKRDDGYRIRWFTPTTEVKLCGHATLAAAHILLSEFNHPQEPIKFRSLSGLLTATPGQDKTIALNFPSCPPSPVAMPDGLAHALGGVPLETLAHEDLIVVYSDATEIEILSPDMSALAKIPYRGICVTAPGNGNGYDFVSRFFAPRVGINEDPVTGSAFTELVPYYAQTQAKREFFARQVSKRGGNVSAELKGDRVIISGTAVTSLAGTLYFKGKS